MRRTVLDASKSREVHGDCVNYYACDKDGAYTRLRVELAVLVRAEQIVPDLGKHLARHQCPRPRREERQERTLSSSRRRRSSSVLSSVMRRVPLISLIPPDLGRA
jgi:hypothetical protein